MNFSNLRIFRISHGVLSASCFTYGFNGGRLISKHRSEPGLRGSKCSPGYFWSHRAILLLDVQLGAFGCRGTSEAPLWTNSGFEPLFFKFPFSSCDFIDHIPELCVAFHLSIGVEEKFPNFFSSSSLFLRTVDFWCGHQGPKLLTLTKYGGVPPCCTTSTFVWWLLHDCQRTFCTS